MFLVPDVLIRSESFESEPDPSLICIRIQALRAIFESSEPYYFTFHYFLKNLPYFDANTSIHKLDLFQNRTSTGT